MLSDTHSDLDMLNQGEYSKYKLTSSKIEMTLAYMIFFKDKSIYNVQAWYKLIMMLWDTLSDLNKLVEVAESVQEHYDHLGTILNRFILEKYYIYMRHIKGGGHDVRIWG